MLFLIFLNRMTCNGVSIDNAVDFILGVLKNVEPD